MGSGVALDVGRFGLMTVEKERKMQLSKFMRLVLFVADNFNQCHGGQLVQIYM